MSITQQHSFISTNQCPKRVDHIELSKVFLGVQSQYLVNWI